MPDFVLPVFYIVMSKFKKRHENQIWWEGWNGMQPLGDMTFDHVNTWQIKNIISQLLQRLQSPNFVGTHMKGKWYHCHMSRDLLYFNY